MMNIEKCMINLKNNNMNCLYFKGRGALYEFIDHFIIDGMIVSVGGSQTLFELGLIDYLRKRIIKFLDRYQPGLSAEGRKSVFRQSFFADAYLTSVNAVTEDGELYFVDGTSNRTAAVLYGPDRVLVIAGTNKIVENLEAAEQRVKEIAAPLNARRLSAGTPCVKSGVCEDCDNPGRICRNYVTVKKPVPGRITVLLLDEKLGF